MCISKAPVDYSALWNFHLVTRIERGVELRLHRNFMVIFCNIMSADIQLILPPVTSNRVVLVLIRPSLTSLEEVLVQMNLN